ncbi:uncharacterized protein [Elaeis guineensis]|uniref:Uncharacterized protein LOC105039781 n=1 Tax=Elaeis guineensis var. tenera TaxID=51953 RepID=A0A6I9QRZ1_ELAGV|nr:uncharacterized protein LOC105039781 [Elaeis guineensis]
MATEVLRPHDVLMAQRMRPLPAFLPRRRPNPNPNPKPSRKTTSPRSEARKRREASPKLAKTGGTTVGEKQVTILRRGESQDMLKKPEIATMFGRGRLGPDPEMVPKQINFGDPAAATKMYAGSAFSVSPSPSSLPLPNFFLKKDESAVVDYATKDLRRLLRLE